MNRLPHRRLASALVFAVVALVLAGCGKEYPNSTFNHTSDHNSDIIALWDRLLFVGTLVFVFVEGLLIYTIIRYRAKPGSPMPKQIHGNHTLEIAWTLIPVLILIPIAIPTVKTIFKTQAPASANALQVEVYGHQWWWEFRYPQYGVTTANELYLPAGRTVSFTLRTVDVLHSFWTPQLAGKRDLITNKTNYLWYTPDSSLVETAFNGFCTEYCGVSHANMRFRAYVTTSENFESWAAGQKLPAAGSPPALAAKAAADSAARRTPARAAIVPAPAPASAPAATAGYIFPADKQQAHNIPRTPVPASIAFDDNLLATADAAAGHTLMTTVANLGKAPCLTCHVIRGEQAYVNDDQARGPNLTHVGTRHTFAGGLFPTTPANLARWIKNSAVMKPGSTMGTLGTGEYSPMLKSKLASGLSDKEIADIVAYMLSLK